MSSFCAYFYSKKINKMTHVSIFLYKATVIFRHIEHEIFQYHDHLMNIS